MDIQSLLDDDVNIVSLPGVYYQFQEAMSSQNTSFAEIGDIIIYDSGLTAKLLKLVNSAYFGLPAKIEKVSHAISWVGTDELTNLLLSTVVIDQFNSIPDSVINMESFWQHSIACGLIARKLASYNEHLDTEKFFIAGMLHDIGQLVLSTKLPALTLKLLLETQTLDKQLHELEHENLGFDHAELGAKLLEKWNLSEFNVETAACHHTPDLAPNYSQETSIIHYADALANSMNLGCSGESAFQYELEGEAWERLQLPDQINLSSLKEEITNSYEEAVDIFLQPK